jgi:hypothetical protein
MKTLLAALCLGLSVARADDLTLFVRPPVETPDWTTPGRLARAGLAHLFTGEGSFFGEVWVELTCGTRRELAGVRPGAVDVATQLLFEGRGLGVLVQSFSGAFADPASLAEARRSGAPRFLRLTLSPDQCRRASRYLAEFRSFKVWRNYNLVARPRHGEGASGASFAVSFLDVLNLLDQEMRERWPRTVLVPRTLAGPPVTDEWIGIFALIRGLDAWAGSGDDAFRFRAWDPALIYEWIGRELAAPKNKDHAVSDGGARGLRFDRSHYPVPEEPLWLQQLDPTDKRKTAVIAEPTRPPKKNRPKTGDEPIVPN